MEQNQLVKIVGESGLEKTKADFILEKFQDYFRIASEWETKAKVLVVTSENQTAEMKMAREGRLFLKQKRVDIEKARKELKEQSLREGKAIDGISNVLKALIEPIEDYLEQQERFVELREEKRKEEIRVMRISEIQSLGLDPTLYDLKNMNEENYSSLVSGQKMAIQQRIEAEKKAEEERIAREKEQERIRIENEHLKKESEKKERQLLEERAKAEAERGAMEEKARKERERVEAEAKKLKAEQDAKLKKERDERERLEAQLKAKAEAEEKERRMIEKERRDAEKAPDKNKLMSLAKAISGFELPEVKSQVAKKIIADTKNLLAKTAKYITDQSEEL